jgi:hypothetical protein
MTAQVSVEFYGLKEALRELQKVDPALRRQVTKDMKAAAEEALLPAIKDAIPASPPTQGFDHAGRTGWRRANQQSQVVFKVDTRKARRRNLQQGAEWESIGTVKVVTKGGPLAIADMAGRGPNRTRNRNPLMARPNFAEVLSSKLGRGPSRFIWFAGERHIDRLTDKVTAIVVEVMGETEKRIVRRG